MSGMRITGSEMDQPRTNHLEDRYIENQGLWIRLVLSRYEVRLTRYAARITLDVERARDVVQEAFLRLIREDRARVEPMLAEWLFTVCRNLALDVRGKEKRMQTLSEEQARFAPCTALPPLEVVEKQETRAEVMKMVECLPGNQQEVIRLKFQEGLSYREISRVTSLTVSHVGVLIHNAMKTLRLRFSSSSDLA